jgi:hypothetical protein
VRGNARAVAADSDKLLRIYLNDHLAAAGMGLALARRCLRNNREGELGAFLERLVREIKEDRVTLEQVMRALGVPRNRPKEAAARLAERVGRLKLNGQLRGYSDLSRLLELEGLRVGIDGKRGLWVSLQESGRALPVDLATLAERAERQRDEVESHRAEAARRAFRRERS